MRRCECVGMIGRACGSVRDRERVCRVYIRVVTRVCRGLYDGSFRAVRWNREWGRCLIAERRVAVTVTTEQLTTKNST